jgi:hypothetical protein
MIARNPSAAAAAVGTWRLLLPHFSFLVLLGSLQQGSLALEPRKPACWFLHGAGEQCNAANGTVLAPEQCPGPSTTPDMMDNKTYWGDFRLTGGGGGGVEMAHCASLHYNHEDTVHQNLMRAICGSASAECCVASQTGSRRPAASSQTQ